MKLFVIAAAAVILWILQGVLYHRFWSAQLKVILTFDRESVVEGENAILRETIINAKPLPLPILHVKFQTGKHLVFTASRNFNITDHNYRSDIFSCMPWQEIRRNLPLICKKRGYYSISQLQLVSYDLFFSSHYVATLPVHTTLYVYPKAADFQLMQMPLRSLMGQILARRSFLSDPFEIQSVRPYQSYDPYRSINWKATAHTCSLKVNIYAPTASWQIMFLLDVDSDCIWNDESLTEEAIRLCGSYSLLLMKEGIPVSIRTNGIDCLTGQWGYLESGAGPWHGKAVMELLARIQIAVPSHPSMEQLLEEISPNLDAKTMFYILISPRQQDSLAEAYDSLCRFAPGSQWIVPLRPGEKVRLTQNHTFSVFPWEAAYSCQPITP